MSRVHRPMRMRPRLEKCLPPPLLSLRSLLAAGWKSEEELRGRLSWRPRHS